MITDSTDVGPAAGFDAQSVLRDPAALAAARRLADLLRAGPEADGSEADGPLSALACGRPVPEAQLDGVVRVEDLVAVGAATVGPDGVALAFGLVAAGPTVVVLPFPTSATDHVYVGADSVWLLRALWRRAPGGDVAVDLGTGTGFLASVLADRYRTVVGTEILPRAASAAALTFALNRRRPGRSTGVCLADVAAGLRPGAFDLVTGNPPWVPDSPDIGRRVFADGGPTGFELPRRFLVEGSSLLRPDGLLVMVMVDPTYTDGTRPLDDVRRDLEARGFTTEVEETAGHTAYPHLLDKLVARFSHLVAAHHVAVIVRRPS